MHLPREADAFNVFCSSIKTGEELKQPGSCLSHPVVWILLTVSCFFLNQCIRFRNAVHHFSLLVDQQDFHRTRSKIDSNNIFHSDSSPSVSRLLLFSE